MLRKLLPLLVFALAASATQAQSAASKVSDFPRFQMTPGKADQDGVLPKSGARLCTLQAKPVCFTMPPHLETSVRVEYEFGLDPVSERLPVQGGGSVIFFLATFSGGGSGTLERAALLRSEPDGSLTNLLPYVAVTNQSQRQMWTLPEISPYPVLVTADFLWDFAAKETHFARHFYEVTVYRYDPAEDRYTKAFSYKTRKKYAGLDERNSVQVLGPEREEIIRRLATAISRR
jgi:hypothetical protein